ncbi:hypothetical protein PENTCL1PPCAC_13149, partial [Pristionchus entomophagus]
GSLISKAEVWSKRVPSKRKRRMSDPPSKKSKNSCTITMNIGSMKNKDPERTSPVHHFNGLAWRLLVAPWKVQQPGGRKDIILICDSEGKSELWRALTDITMHVTH